MTDTEVERRLRQALAARAAAVTADRLQIGVAPPTVAARRTWPERWWLPLPASVAAAAVVALVFAVLRMTAAPDPLTPGGPPPSAPTTSISPSRAPSPSLTPSSFPLPSSPPTPTDTGGTYPRPTATGAPDSRPTVPGSSPQRTGQPPAPTKSPTAG